MMFFYVILVVLDIFFLGEYLEDLEFLLVSVNLSVFEVDC